MTARTTMECYPSGLWFDFSNPQPDQIELEDIANALSNTCRFGGHVPWHLSVAEHACLVRRLVIEDGYPELALAALHHDSHEAFAGDVPTPLKNVLRQAGTYSELVDAIDLAICLKLDINLADLHHPAIVRADRHALRMEAAVVKLSGGVGGAWEHDELPDLPDDWHPGMPPEDALAAFLGAHHATQNGNHAILAHSCQ